MEIQDEISHKISTGIYTVQPKRKKSEVWTAFGEIEKEDGSILRGFVYCRLCSKIYKYNGAQTSNLNKHACAQITRSQPPLKPLTQKEKDALLEVCVQWLVQDCRPMSILGGAGFKSLVQTFLYIGSKFGEYVHRESLIPDSTAIACRLSEMTQKYKTDIKEQMQFMLQKQRATITTSLWADERMQRNLLCTTLHYYADRRMNAIVLGIKCMDNAAATDQCIRGKIEASLAEFELRDISNIIFVTDDNSNVKNALSDVTRLNCSNRLFSKVVESAFNSIDGLRLITKACKKLFKYFKDAQLEHLLKITSISRCTTRWSSQFHLFKSISANWNKITENLAESGEVEGYASIDQNILEILVDIYESFEMISTKLQDSEHISLSYVYPSINSLRKVCATKDTDPLLISDFKSKILQGVNQIWIPNLHTYHKLAYFLYPPTNCRLDEASIEEIKDFCKTNLRDICERDQKETKDLIKTEVEEFENVYIKSEISFSDYDLPSTSDVELNRSKEVHFFFSDLIDGSENQSRNSVLEEIDKYCNARVPITNSFDALEWWETYSVTYPKLSQLALKVLSIPASSTASENVIALAGDLTAEQSHPALPKTVNSILFLNSLKSLLKKDEEDTLLSV